MKIINRIGYSLKSTKIEVVQFWMTLSNWMTKVKKFTLSKIGAFFRAITKFVKNVFSSMGAEIVFIILVFLLIAMRNAITIPTINWDQDILYNFLFQWLGIVVALSAGGLVGHGWSRLLKINSAIRTEASTLKLLIQTFTALSDGEYKRQLIMLVSDYFRHIRKLGLLDRDTDSDSSKIMRRIHFHILEIPEAANGTDLLKSESLRLYNQAYEARHMRFESISQELPKQIWFGFMFFCIGWMWGFLLIENIPLHLALYILGFSALAVSYILYAALDLNNFRSHQLVNFRPFEYNDLEMLRQMYCLTFAAADGAAVP